MAHAVEREVKPSLEKFVRLFYLVAIVLSSRFYLSAIDWTTETPSHVLWPVAWVFSSAQSWVVPSMFVSLAATSVLVLWKTKYQVVRVLFFVLYFLMIAMQYSYHGQSHVYHTSLYVLLIWSVIPTWTQTRELELANVMQLSYAAVIVPYFLSALWKIFYFGHDLIVLGASDSTLDPLGVKLASFYVHYYHYHPLGDWLINSAVWGKLVYIMIVLFELSSVAVLLFKRFLPLWGVLAIFFHLGIYLVLGVDFKEMLAVSLYFSLSPVGRSFLKT